MKRTDKLSPHFRLAEFLKNADPIPPANVLANLKRLAEKLEEVRTKLGDRPLIITSGWRSPEHNGKVGGAPRSYHLQGLAADFIVQGMTSHEARLKLDAWWPGGMELETSHVHLDLRPNRARFKP